MKIGPLNSRKLLDMLVELKTEIQELRKEVQGLKGTKTRKKRETLDAEK